MEAYTDSDYTGASLDRKSTTEGCQFLVSRLISWQCKKQTVVANSTTEVEYVAAANCCGQVLWIQNQMPDRLMIGTVLPDKKLMLIGQVSDATLPLGIKLLRVSLVNYLVTSLMGLLNSL
ncbi:hypothetical protein Tco_0749980 [Tanacetum coccineum]|uniref:Uncharacterized protein n=1 Tax=Tanacetum coccineum TaxID=301880 RepID=A0ABQ4YZX8_9ASTR